MPIPNNLHLLVIEDNPNLLQEAKMFFDGFTQQTARHLALRVSYATNLEEALTLLPEVDGVLCDMFFPANSSGPPVLLHSIEILNQCRVQRKPVVVLRNVLDGELFELEEEIEDLFHSAPTFGINMNGLVKEEAYNPSPNWKPWNQALHALLYRVAGLKYGVFQFNHEGEIIPRKPFPEFTTDFPLVVCEVQLDYEKEWGKAFENFHGLGLRRWAWTFTATDSQIQRKRRKVLEEDRLSQLLQAALYPRSEEGERFRREEILRGPLRGLILAIEAKAKLASSSNTPTEPLS